MLVNDRRQFIIAPHITIAVCKNDSFLRRGLCSPQEERLPLTLNVRMTALLSCPSAVSAGFYFTELILRLPVIPASIQTTPSRKP